MELRLSRRWYTEESTVGQLLVNERHQCWVLEDKVRHPDEDKIYGRTANSIPQVVARVQALEKAAGMT